MNDIKAEKPLWSVEDLAEYLGVNVGVIYGLRYRREGPPAVRVGRELRFDPAAVRRWLESRTEKAS